MDTVDEIRSKSDIQKLLKDGFDSKSLRKFQHAISLGAHLNEPFEVDECEMTVYEKVLSTYGYFKFVRACINAGCDVNYKNPELGKAAINYVVDSRDSRNLKELLDHGSQILDIDYMYKGETVLNTLVKSLEEEESEQVAKCIRMLIYSGACPNLSDRQGLTPLENLLNNERVSISFCCDLVSVFIRKQNLSLPLYRRGLSYLLSNSKDFFTRFENTPNLPYDMLVRNFMNMKKDILLNSLKHCEHNFKGWDRKRMQQRLLLTYIEDQGSKAALDAAIAMILPDAPQDNEELIDIAIEAGSWSTVLALLEVEHIKSLPLKPQLRATIAQVPMQELLDRKAYEDCLIALLKQDESLLAMMDDDGNTPLHYATQCRNEIAIRVLLRNGAPMGVPNKKGELPFENIDRNLLEEHFNHCITDHGQKPSHKDYEIVMNYTNLTNEKNDPNMKHIAYMAKSKSLSPLLLHPLITCFLHLKWQRLTHIFTARFFMFVLFSIALIEHILLRFPTPIGNEVFVYILTSFCLGYVIYMLAVIVLKYWFLKDLPHWLDIPLVVVTVLTCLEVGENKETQRAIAIAAILLTSLKFSILVGTLPVPKVSTHMLILRQVTITFVKSLSHYLILLLTFAAAFYLIYAETDRSAEGSVFLTFADVPKSLLRTLAMFRGVINGDHEFAGYWSTIIVLLFMFLTMILSNLLNAMAVSDTLQIRDEIELNAVIHRVNMLMEYGGSLKKSWLATFLHCGCRLIKSNYDYLSIFPNQSNKARVYNKIPRKNSLKPEDKRAPIDTDSEDDEGNDSNVSGNHNYHAIEIDEKTSDINEEIAVDKETVVRALNILQANFNSDAEKRGEELEKKRLNEMYNKLESNSEMLENMKDTLSHVMKATLHRA